MLYRILTCLFILVPIAVAAQVQEAEFNGLSAWELTFGNSVQTDCKTELVNQKTGQIFCFSSDAEKAAFEHDLEENIKRAKAGYMNLSD